MEKTLREEIEENLSKIRGSLAKGYNEYLEALEAAGLDVREVTHSG